VYSSVQVLTYLDYFFIPKKRDTEQDLKYLKTAHNLEEREREWREKHSSKVKVI
jgi:hypothetical protein